MNNVVYIVGLRNVVFGDYSMPVVCIVMHRPQPSQSSLKLHEQSDIYAEMNLLLKLMKKTDGYSSNPSKNYGVYGCETKEEAGVSLRTASLVTPLRAQTCASAQCDPQPFHPPPLPQYITQQQIH